MNNAPFSLLSTLPQEGHDTGAPAAAALASLLDPSLARQEYLTNGQQGLDDLLAALSTTSTASSPTVSTDATGGFLTASVEDLDAAAAGAGRAAARRDTTRAHPAGVGGDGLDALRDLLDGKAAAPAVSDWAARSGSATGPASGPGSTGGASAPAPSGVSCSAASEALSKVVMARRTTLRLEGELDPLHVLQVCVCGGGMWVDLGCGFWSTGCSSTGVSMWRDTWGCWETWMHCSGYVGGGIRTWVCLSEQMPHDAHAAGGYCGLARPQQGH